MIEPKKLKKTRKTHPRFKRPNQGRTKRSRIDDNWRRPRGTGNKQRQKLRQAGALPSLGYRNPSAVRGLHPRGMKELLVHNIKQLNAVDKDEYVVRIASSVGARKRALLIRTADKLGIHVLNRRQTGR